MTEPCKYEGEIAVLKQICENDLPAIKVFLTKIFDRLEGTNGDGLVTRTRIVENEIAHVKENIPTMKKAMKLGMVWGAISGAITIVLFFGIKSLA